MKKMFFNILWCLGAAVGIYVAITAVCLVCSFIVWDFSYIKPFFNWGLLESFILIRLWLVASVFTGQIIYWGEFE